MAENAADDGQQAPPTDKPGDMALVNQMMTAYLYGLYTYKKGQLSAPDAMDHILGLLQKAEQARDTGKDYMERMMRFSKERLKEGFNDKDG